MAIHGAFSKDLDLGIGDNIGGDRVVLHDVLKARNPRKPQGLDIIVDFYGPG